MRVITDIQFRHESISGLTLITITKQKFAVEAHHEFRITEAGPDRRQKDEVIVATLSPVGKPLVEEITIGP